MIKEDSFLTLHNRITELTGRVIKVGTANERIDELRAFQMRLAEIRQDLNKLEPILKSLKVLQGEGIDIQLSFVEVSTARQKRTEVAKRFQEELNYAALTRGRSWPQMREAVDRVATAAKDAGNKSWRDFVTTEFSGERPEDLERTLAPTKENQDGLAHYRREFRSLRELTKGLPVDREPVKRARELIQVLRDIDRKFQRNVPPAVKRFLEAVAVGSASLALLDKEVLDWLDATDSRDLYRIIARR